MSGAFILLAAAIAVPILVKVLMTLQNRLERGNVYGDKNKPTESPHTHNWNVWEIIKEGNVSYDDLRGNTHIIGRYLDQKRRCKECGKFELNSQVTNPLNLWDQ